MAVCWGFAMVLVVTTVALFTFSQPLFQAATPEEAVGIETRAHVDTVLLVAAVPRGDNPLISEARDDAESSSSISTAAWSSFDFLQRRTTHRRQHRQHRQHRQKTRKLIPHLPPGVVVERHPPSTSSAAKLRPPGSRRSVLASFQSDRMVPTGPNPLHNSNRSQVNFP